VASCTASQAGDAPPDNGMSERISTFDVRARNDHFPAVSRPTLNRPRDEVIVDG
jgi:hypothetical protein